MVQNIFCLVNTSGPYPLDAIEKVPNSPQFNHFLFWVFAFPDVVLDQSEAN